MSMIDRCLCGAPLPPYSGEPKCGGYVCRRDPARWPVEVEVPLRKLPNRG